MKYFCRSLNCPMSYSSSAARQQHENIMHKDMQEKAIQIILSQIFKVNDKEKLDKKVVKTANGLFSYNEIKEILKDKDNPDYLSVNNIMKSLVKTYFETFPNHGMKELLNVAEFNIA